MNQVEVMDLDLASLDSVRSFAKAFSARKLPLHLLVCNAGRNNNRAGLAWGRVGGGRCTRCCSMLVTARMRLVWGRVG